jgi:hypothetical protein
MNRIEENTVISKLNNKSHIFAFIIKQDVIKFNRYNMLKILSHCQLNLTDETKRFKLGSITTCEYKFFLNFFD